MPVRVKKTRKNKQLEPRSDSIGSEKALAKRRICIGMPHFALLTIDDIGVVVNADAARRVPSLCEPYAAASPAKR
jgi:hypothetical protein